MCHQCGYAASQNAALKNHIEAVHNKIKKMKIKNHVCGECGYSAYQKKDLKIHIDSVHEKIRNHVCGKCGHSAKRKQHLKLHIEKMHKKDGGKVGGHNEDDKDTAESLLQQNDHLPAVQCISEVSAASDMANVDLNICHKGVNEDKLGLTEESPSQNEEDKEQNGSQEV